MTFREPEVEPNSEGGAESYPPEPPISDMEIWLEWQACQLSTLSWWLELRAIPGVKDLRKLICKIHASFSIPEVRMRPFPKQEYTAPPAPKCLDRNSFLLDELSYQDIWQQPALLTITYTRGLQYWVVELIPLESPDFCPLAGGVVELREAVREHVTFTNWDILQGLGAVHPGATNQWPQTSLCNQAMPPLGEESSGLDTSFTEATTQTTSPAATDMDTVSHGNPPFGMESKTQYLLVITTSIEQLSLGPSGDNLERLSTAPSRGNTFQNPWMAAVFSGSTRAVNYQGATVRELED